MSDLRNRLIRLAHTNPEMRQPILSLLDETGQGKVAGGDLYMARFRLKEAKPWLEVAVRLYGNGARSTFRLSLDNNNIEYRGDPDFLQKALQEVYTAGGPPPSYGVWKDAEIYVK